MQEVAYFTEIGNALVDIFLVCSLNISTIRKQKLQNYMIGLKYKQIGCQRWNEHRGKGRNREMAIRVCNDYSNKDLCEHKKRVDKDRWW